MKNKDLNFKKYIPYEVDFDYLNNQVDFYLTHPGKENKKEQFFDIIDFFKDKKFVEPLNASFLKSFRVKCDKFEYIIQCNNLVARQVLLVLLNIQNSNESIYNTWYLYDYDTCNEMPQFIHSFFITNNSKIIVETVKISSSIMDECDPNILIKESVINCPDSCVPLWTNMEADLKAQTSWYYQKFYKDTIIGQIQYLKGKSKSKNLPILAMDQSSSLDQISLLSSINASLKWLVLITIITLIKMFI